MYDLTSSGLADHWIDLLVATLIAALGYFIDGRLRDFDARHKRAEDKFERLEAQHSEVCERIARLEIETRRHENVS